MSCCDAGAMSVQDALNTMLVQITPVRECVTVSLANSQGHILAEDVLSPLNMPPFDNSAMDGYAFRFAEWVDGQTLAIAGTALAGQPFTADIPAGACLRIMTGAQVPAGLDTVIMQEHMAQTPEGVLFTQPPKAKANIRYLGEEIRTGDVVLKAGSRLHARALPLLATLGLSEIKVRRRLKVAIFSTGDELKMPGTPLQAGEIYDSNRYGIEAMLNRMGIECLNLGIIPDDPAQLRDTFIQAAQSADAIITSGGVSVGEADYTKDLLLELGEVGFWSVAMKPGKPFAFGKIRDKHFFGLPGNPVSAFVTFYQLVQPALRKLAGEITVAPLRIPAIAEHNFRSAKNRVDFQRGLISVNADGLITVRSTGAQGSGMFTSLCAANCFVIVEKDVPAGSSVTIELFNEIVN
ncbi:molybdenum cofactor synthesis domain protein [Tolumonas auensis DSM 9187]|uniref:Molybdopterin molybdenumtransferase n=1 Tax=Tolumonas auensis (strain DSM 9187 / NBRC 110442 / TA 4) TaxID=595494 RepID=C4LFK5_TOLAT|nr:molybdopterin molybdotransferase MoeA [Tolumonas auensis]ACQ93372.1 molybdenum cofactor synthesis domain protein [Tolumonas auensis DSM 9187]